MAPKAGPGRTCGMSGTADTHEFHLERIVKKCVEERGFSEIVDDDPHVIPYPEQPLVYFIVQMDKSTCQTYNLQENFFGYRDVEDKIALGGYCGDVRCLYFGGCASNAHFRC